MKKIPALNRPPVRADLNQLTCGALKIFLKHVGYRGMLGLNKESLVTAALERAGMDSVKSLVVFNQVVSGIDPSSLYWNY